MNRAVPQDVAPDRAGEPAGADPGASTMFDLLPVGAYRTTPEGTVLRANAALVRFNGYATEAELLERCRDVAREWYVDPLQRARFRERIEREGQITGFVSEVYRHFTRERAWVNENAHIVRDDAGRVLYYEGTIEEVTDRVRAQAALQRSESLLRLITQHLPCLVYRMRQLPDGARSFDYVSDGVRGLFGVGPEVLLADSVALEKYRHPDDHARVSAEVRRCGMAGLPLNVEYRIVLDSGELKWVHLVSHAVQGQAEGPMRVGLVIDITAQKQSADWRAERDRAEAADRAKTQLLSRVSHELRTPLNAVLGFGQLLESDAGLGPRQKLWTQQIVASGQHLLGLVDDVLDLSAAQAGQLNLSSGPVDWRRVLEEAWTMLAVTGVDVGLQFEAGDDTPQWVHADARRLRQVMSNLLSNAVKYNRTGGRIAARFTALRAGDLPGHAAWVELALADSGVGMTPEQLLRLFNPFERLGAQHTAVPGTGLGLALSKQLVEAMDGHIAAESVAGAGSVFTVRLPGSAPAATGER